jgi:hypothetical protein
MSLRRFERIPFIRSASWDYFSDRKGKKWGYIDDVSRGGCLLRTNVPIEHRRWIRLRVDDENSNVSLAWVGQVIRAEQKIEVARASGDNDFDITIYRYGVRFTHPGQLSAQDFDLILALSSKNLTVDSCLSLNSKSS